MIVYRTSCCFVTTVTAATTCTAWRLRSIRRPRALGPARSASRSSTRDTECVRFSTCCFTTTGTLCVWTECFTKLKKNSKKSDFKNCIELKWYLTGNTSFSKKNQQNRFALSKVFRYRIENLIFFSS